ncbi:MAG: MBL fold metallo-hydrolase [Bacteroidota bacterium]
MSGKSFLKKVLKVIKYSFLALAVLILIGVVYINVHPTFGASPDEESLKKMEDSKYYRDGKFHNLVPTTLMTTPRDGDSDFSILEFFFPPEGKNPTKPLPSKKIESAKIKGGTFTWLGHASMLMKTGGLTILTDPVFERASPLPVGVSPFATDHPFVEEDLPKINVIVISHDHYDHLEYNRIKSFAQKVDQFFVPLGVKAHVMKWGVDGNKIVEMDWYESTTYEGVRFTLVPSRHFSGRGVLDGSSTLWGGWIFKTEAQNIYFSGDSGYFDEFKEIGKNYGPFDIAFIDSGAYHETWATVHMMPEQSVQANIDLQSKVYLPIGWSKFDLAPHVWDDPIIRASAEAEKRQVMITTPLIGETFTLDKLPQSKWWEGL